jgi:hypothetical protein
MNVEGGEGFVGENGGDTKGGHRPNLARRDIQQEVLRPYIIRDSQESCMPQIRGTAVELRLNFVRTIEFHITGLPPVRVDLAGQIFSRAGIEVSGLFREMSSPFLTECVPFYSGAGDIIQSGCTTHPQNCFPLIGCHLVYDAGSVMSLSTVPSSFVIFRLSDSRVAVPWMKVANFGCGAPPMSWAMGWPSFAGIQR